jgi:hypothetical protein
MKVKRVKTKREIWPYPEGTILVSYGGKHAHLYYSEERIPFSDNGDTIPDLPGGRGLNISLFMAKGAEYYSKYFVDLEPVSFEDTPWSKVIDDQLKKTKDGIKQQIANYKEQYEKHMGELNNKLNEVEQEYIDYFGIDINSEVVDLTKEEPPQEPDGSWNNRNFNTLFNFTTA